MGFLQQNLSFDDTELSVTLITEWWVWLLAGQGSMVGIGKATHTFKKSQNSFDSQLVFCYFWNITFFRVLSPLVTLF
jgi:hypothetical protein